MTDQPCTATHHSDRAHRFHREVDLVQDRAECAGRIQDNPFARVGIDLFTQRLQQGDVVALHAGRLSHFEQPRRARIHPLVVGVTEAGDTPLRLAELGDEILRPFAFVPPKGHTLAQHPACAHHRARVSISDHQCTCCQRDLNVIGIRVRNDASH
ncbi:hypothetical protein D3C87_1662950 [compost metagenome]